jgi:hypothetical protein
VKRVLSAVSVLCLLFVALPAHAAEDTDPDDKAGFLDLAELIAEGDKGEVGKFTIKTHEGFACNYLKPSSDNYLKLVFDDRRDGDADLVGRFKCIDNALMLFLHGSETGSDYEPIRADRPRAKVTRVSVPMDLLEFEGNHMGVKVLAKDATNVDCKPDACKDRIPSSGDLKVY